MLKLYSLIALVVLCPVMAAAQSTTVTGRVLGSDGRPMPLAHVFAYIDDSLRSVEAGKDGRFSITTDRLGYVPISFTGVDHTTYRLGLFVDKPGTIELTARLERPEYNESIDSLIVVGDFNRFSLLDGGIPMKKRSDGRFEATFTTSTDTFAYQLVGVSGSIDPDGRRSINGQQATRYRYDGGGDYISIVKAPKGKITILFDPAKIDRSSAKPRVEFANPRSTPARFAAIKEEVDRLRTNSTPAALLQTLAKRIEGETDLFTRQALLLYYTDVRATGKDSAIGLRTLREIPVTSPLWGYNPYWALQVLNTAKLRLDDPQAEKFLTEIVDTHPDRNTRASVLAQQASYAYHTKKQTQYLSYYNRLQQEYGETSYAEYAKAEIGPDRAIQVGRQVPDFRFASIEDPTVIYTRDNMKGKYYMIDFWATWCGPCIGELDHMHAAYDRFKGRNFQILSLSFDGKQETVTQFRQKKWKMPWLHTFIDGAFDSEAAKAFEVRGIPKPMLVDPNGMIVATEEELRGDDLEKTLARVLEGKGNEMGSAR